MPTVAIFEDQFWKNFDPISLTRPVFDIKVGARSYFEEYEFAHGQPPAILLTRKYLSKITKENHGKCEVNPTSIDADTIFVNGLVHPAILDVDRLSKISHSFLISAKGRLLVARLPKKSAEYLCRCVYAGSEIKVKNLDVEKSTDIAEAEGLLTNIWDLVKVLENALESQTNFSESTADLSGISVLGGHPIVIENAEIEQGTVIDNRKGGVYIGPEAKVQPCRIIGPAYIEGKTQVKQFSIIEKSYIGYNCRVAGEIEHSVIMDHTNKAHDGFVGHSYFCPWINIGAMSTTSDLKITYGNIKMDGIDTGQNKIGVFLGDMVKTAICSILYSSSRVGVSSQVYGLAAKDVPSFSIHGEGIGSKNVEMQLESAIQTQKRMMGRRDREMSNAYEQMIKDVFLMTAESRKKSGIRKGKFTI